MADKQTNKQTNKQTKQTIKQTTKETDTTNKKQWSSPDNSIHYLKLKKSQDNISLPTFFLNQDLRREELQLDLWTAK